jgi:heme-degrading monooxygenase HmoA
MLRALAQHLLQSNIEENDMIIERAEIPVIPGREAEFEAAIGHCRALLAGAKGCTSVQIARGVESPSKFLLLLTWECIEDHVAFTHSAEFGQFREVAGPYFAAKPAMEHFAPISEKCPFSFTNWIKSQGSESQSNS